MERVVLHIDMNHCYASIELLHHPELRGKPLAVAGDPEARHGIVLAKDPLAKKAGVSTGMALWQAKQVCPKIRFVPARMDLYLRFSRMAHEIYGEYTDLQEPFGLDESWLDVTGSCPRKGDGRAVAQEIRERVRAELGITVSIGVSWNKIFAKLGSDYKKPDAVTQISRDNYQKIAWPLPAEDLLYVGPATKRKLNGCAIRTIGDLAQADPAFLQSLLGRAAGQRLYACANGLDGSPVRGEDTAAPVKSIGNSTTTPRDLVCGDDVRLVFYLLAESVAARLREHRLKGRVIEISVRDGELHSGTRQCRRETATDSTREIAQEAIRLFRDWDVRERPVRSLGLRAADLVSADFPEQLSLFESFGQREKQRRADAAVDEIRRRFGYFSVQRGIMYTDPLLSAVDIGEEHGKGSFSRQHRSA